MYFEISENKGTTKHSTEHIISSAHGRQNKRMASSSAEVDASSSSPMLTSSSPCCIVCNSASPKYKCTVCRSPFCSAVCSKAHKGSEACAAIVADMNKEKKKANENDDGEERDGVVQDTVAKKRARDDDGGDADAEEGAEADDTTHGSSLISYALGGGGSAATQRKNKKIRAEDNDDDEDANDTDAGGDLALQGPLAHGASFVEETDEVYDDDGNIQILGSRQLDAIRGNKRLRDMLRTKELRSMIKMIDRSRSRLDALEAAMHNSYDFNAFCDMLLGIIYQNS